MNSAPNHLSIQPTPSSKKLNSSPARLAPCPALIVYLESIRRTRFKHPMKAQTTILLLLALSSNVFPQAAEPAQSFAPAGILQSIQNAGVARAGDTLLLTPIDPHAPIEIVCTRCQGLGIQFDENQWWALPINATGAHIDANRTFWLLPVDPASSDHAWRLEFDGTLSALKTAAGLTVTLLAPRVVLSQAEARPHSDPFGNRFSFDFAGGARLEQALASFYWGTMLPSVVEKTFAVHFPYHDGYVLSTLNVSSYAGSYPAVDHEFQIKGRLAVGSVADLDIVRRMIGLQFHLINDDPERLYRMPTSVQPDGRREYHVRRNSQDDRQNAAMFPVTGNIEVIEESWRYYEATKDSAWLRSNIQNLEHSANWVLSNTDQYGRVWSDVYYEDQVIKDGRVTQAQAFAAHNFRLLAEMETLLARRQEAERFTQAAKRMARVLVAPLPMGYWDMNTHRFIDWVDRDGRVHDHIHLLANELPVTFGYATAQQAAGVRRLIDDHAGEFERFPSFVAANIADYDKSEIGSGGPYDLCAAGRYWYWDAAYRASQQQNSLLLDQLKTVAAEAARNAYFMSERYDMDHVYYIDGKDAHGAEKYYEYPNVFASVLIGNLLGLTIPADADVSVAPRLTSSGAVELAMPQYALRYIYSPDGFTLRNLSDKPRRYIVDLSNLRFTAPHFRLVNQSQSQVVGPHATLTLLAHQEARWTPAP